MITNYEMELSAFLIHKATLLAEVPDARLETHHSGSDNSLAVSWSTKDASTINPVVVDLFCIHALHLSQLFINPSIFNHLGIKNRMEDDAS